MMKMELLIERVQVVTMTAGVVRTGAQ